jgi:type IV secretion system protein VirB10
MASFPPAVDPRPTPDDAAPPADSAGVLRPAVAGTSTGASTWLIGGGVGLMGLCVFLWLSSHRTHPLQTAAVSTPAVETSVVPDAPAAPPGLEAMEAASRGVVPKPSLPPAMAIVTPPPTPIVSVGAPQGPPPAMGGPPPNANGKAPALVVDLSDGAAAVAAAAPGATGKPGEAGAAAAGGNADEQFAARVEGSAEPDRARATMLRNKSTTVPQGTMIPAVLETALNSDLPGFTRAVVSRDVRSFDGSIVLIPRGSRVIGQYKSAAAAGQSRAFVVWTRILRPDGGSIQIGSAGGDELGRAGLAGKVDRHFFEQFSGAILLTVLEGGLSALSNNPSTTVVVGSSGSGLGSAASSLTPQAIPPTIRVAQGSPIRIFVARDLDFTPLQNAAQ